MTDTLTLSALVNNRAGVLLRVAGLFARRGFNITSLTVSETEHPEFSRMTVVSQVAREEFAQVEAQLEKLEDVIRVLRLEDGESLIASELLLIKISAPNARRPGALKIISAFGARVRDIGHQTITAELTGAAALIDEFIKALEPQGIVELSRSGITALESGDKSLLLS
jgi:acetolactate synthase-1/3 small subunit